MIVFFRQIPSTTRIHEITDFIESALNKGAAALFGKKGYIKQVKIVALKDNDLKTVEYHGLATIIPDEAARRVIDRLNRKPFKGKRIAVREYIARSWQNDRRSENREIPENIANRREHDRRSGSRRQGERRRKNLEVAQDITNQFKGYKNASRKL
ncbi:MAG: RNA recognition motif domain-containing protein [Gammaproteobacteria bacterium]